jgi:hypothetical protein
MPHSASQSTAKESESLRRRLREFVDAELIPREKVLAEESEASEEVMADLKAAAKSEGLSGRSAIRPTSAVAG